MAQLTVMATAKDVADSVMIDRPHPNGEVRARFGSNTPLPLAQLCWHPDGQTVAPGLGPTLQLTKHVGWQRSADEIARVDTRDVVKQVSFLAKSDSVTMDEFRIAYRHHVEVARRHMPALWQYVQYDVVVGADAPLGGALAPEAPDVVSVSVLWFATTDDFLNRYFASPEDQAQFQAQEGFLDLARAFSFVCATHPATSTAVVL